MCCVKLVDTEKNLLITALNKDLVSITGSVFNMMEIKEENGQQKGGSAFCFWFLLSLASDEENTIC